MRQDIIMSGCDLTLREGKWKENGKFMLESLGCTTNCLMTNIRVTYAADSVFHVSTLNAFQVDGAGTRDGFSEGEMLEGRCKATEGKFMFVCWAVGIRESKLNLGMPARSHCRTCLC